MQCAAGMPKVALITSGPPFQLTKDELLKAPTSILTQLVSKRNGGLAVVDSRLWASQDREVRSLAASAAWSASSGVESSSQCNCSCMHQYVHACIQIQLVSKRNGGLAVVDSRLWASQDREVCPGWHPAKILLSKAASPFLG